VAKDRAPSFQFYPRDFVSDPAVLGMSLAACGAYIRLLCAAWVQEDVGVLPDDDVLLARWAQATRGEWKRIRPEVAAAFDCSQPGVWRQRRMVVEREKQLERFQRASEAGTKAARGRWNGISP